MRLWRQIWEDDVLGRCAELAYFFLFSVFPLLLFLTTLLGYLAGASAAAALEPLLVPRPGLPQPGGDGAPRQHPERDHGGAQRRQALPQPVRRRLGRLERHARRVGRTLNAACGFKETRRWWQPADHRDGAHGRLRDPDRRAPSAPIFYGGLDRRRARGAAGHRRRSSPSSGRSLRWPLVLVFVMISFEMVYNYAPEPGGEHRPLLGHPGRGHRRRALLLAPPSACASISPTSTPTPRPMARWAR